MFHFLDWRIYSQLTDDKQQQKMGSPWVFWAFPTENLRILTKQNAKLIAKCCMCLKSKVTNSRNLPFQGSLPTKLGFLGSLKKNKSINQTKSLDSSDFTNVDSKRSVFLHQDHDVRSKTPLLGGIFLSLGSLTTCGGRRHRFKALQSCHEWISGYPFTKKVDHKDS